MADSTAAFLQALMGGASGANVDDIMNFRKDIEENNILNDLAPAILGAKFKTDTWTPTETLGVTAGQAFLGTLLSGLARRDAAEQFSDVASILPQLYENPGSVSVPEGVDPEAFGALKLATIARGSRQKADSATSFIKELLGKELNLAFLEKEAAASAGGKIRGESAANKALYGDSPLNPNDPAGELRRKLESDTYSRISALPQYKMYADLESNFKALESLAKQDSKAADLGLISTIARIRDPQSVVREGEIVMNADTQAYLDSVVGNWRSIATGESRLKPVDKARIIGSVVPKYNELGASYLASRNPLLDALEKQGGFRSNIPTPEFSPFDSTSLLNYANEVQEFTDLAKSLNIPKQQAKMIWEARGK